MRNFPNHGRMLIAVLLILLKISVLSVCGQDRTEYQSKWVENQLNLHDHVEELSSIGTIQSMGFTGQGTAIAVISTGIDKNHEQFGGRVIAETCFNRGRKCVPTERCDICGDTDKECFRDCYDCEDHFVCENNGNSSNPVNALRKDSFNRGSHLTGIAAGADGIAPGANIIAVNIQSEYSNIPDLISEENPEGYAVSMEKEDLMKALKWLLQLQIKLKNEGKTPISIVEIDFSSDEYDFQCDWEDGCEDFFDIFEEMIDEGMIPVAGTGDHYNDVSISFPACLSNVIAAGALPDMSKPMIAAYSDHNNMADIIAPGSYIYSAILADRNEDGNITCEDNCYGEMAGTSEAASVTGGALALLKEAFPGKSSDEYKSMLQEMSARSVNRRNSNTHDNLTNDDGTGTQFEFNKPILDFSDFTSYYKNFVPDAEGTVTINDQIPQGGSGNALIGDIHTKDQNGINAIVSDEKTITAGNITAEGKEANGIDAVVFSEDGKLTLNIYDNISAGNAGIVIYEDNAGPLDIFVPGTINAGNIGILIAPSKTKTQADFPENITITAGKIIPNQNGNIAEYEDGTKAETIENDINYIISVDKPKNGSVEIVREDGTPWAQQNHRCDTANKGQRVFFRASAGLEVCDRNTGKMLPQTGNGLYYLEVPNGGSVKVYTKSKSSGRMDFFFSLSELPKTGFSALHPQELHSKPLNVRYASTNLMIQIPQLSIESKLLLVPEISGEYPVEWLGDSIGMLEGSALPGEGIMVLTGHNHLNTTENGPFIALGSLALGDRIFLTDANDNLYPYKISGNYKIDADGFASIAGNLGENTLVMMTCEDEAASGGYLHRRVIFADPL